MMRIFSKLIVSRPLLPRIGYHGTRLMWHCKSNQFGTNISPQYMPYLTSLTQNDAVNPLITEDLILFRDNCRNLEELELITKYCKEEHYSLFLDIVKANPNLKDLSVSVNAEMIDWIVKNPPKLECVKLWQHEYEVSLGKTAQLLSVIPSLVTLMISEWHFYVDFNEQHAQFITLKIEDLSSESIKAFVDVVRGRITQWSFSFVTDVLLNEIVNEAETAACPTHFTIFQCLPIKNLLTLSSLKKLFTSCPKLFKFTIQQAPLTSEEFDELFALIPESLEELVVGGANLTVANVMKLLKNSKNLKCIIVSCDGKCNWKHWKWVTRDLRQKALERLKIAVKEHPTIMHFSIKKSDYFSDFEWEHATIDSKYN